MIVGNPNTGKKTATAVIAVLLVMVLVTIIVSVRKKTAPLKEPPMHPSTLITLRLPGQLVR
jgi:LPXTG-motif cell wall-anchored protein